MDDEFPNDLHNLSIAANKLAAAADKAAELMGAAVSQLDEIRREVVKMNKPIVQEFPLLIPQAGGLSEWITSDGKSWSDKKSATNHQTKVNGGNA